jgi:Flp pilus assembly protein TadG
MTVLYVNQKTISDTEVPGRGYTLVVSAAPHKRRVRTLGAAGAEFAVILPLAVSVMFGAIEAGRMLACRQMLTFAAMEGARKAAALGTLNVAAVESKVIGYAPMLSLTAGSIDVQVMNPGSFPTCATAGVWGAVDNAAAFTARVANTSCVRVTVRYNFDPLILGNVFNPPQWTDVQTMTVL